MKFLPFPRPNSKKNQQQLNEQVCCERVHCRPPKRSMFIFSRSIVIDCMKFLPFPRPKSKKNQQQLNEQVCCERVHCRPPKRSMFMFSRSILIDCMKFLPFPRPNSKKKTTATERAGLLRASSLSPAKTLHVYVFSIDSDRLHEVSPFSPAEF